ncbi:hypothetical protein OJAV_G00219360 [Oryzias javanicus]|uniref:Uncharacterized protein n=1 Tax=Oryzias javanicus TaxID=123683 RepID=A0A3S2NPL8_ORYJA|nr:hypothetical protein OJAV_G00219360 [Oryzias javanicus]
MDYSLKEFVCLCAESSSSSSSRSQYHAAERRVLRGLLCFRGALMTRLQPILSFPPEQQHIHLESANGATDRAGGVRWSSLRTRTRT